MRLGLERVYHGVVAVAVVVALARRGACGAGGQVHHVEGEVGLVRARDELDLELVAALGHVVGEEAAVAVVRVEALAFRRCVVGLAGRGVALPGQIVEDDGRRLGSCRCCYCLFCCWLSLLWKGFVDKRLVLMRVIVAMVVAVLVAMLVTMVVLGLVLVGLDKGGLLEAEVTCRVDDGLLTLRIDDAEQGELVHGLAGRTTRQAHVVEHRRDDGYRQHDDHNQLAVLLDELHLLLLLLLVSLMCVRVKSMERS